MSRGMLEERWEHTSWMMAHLANIHRDPKKPAFKPAQFNPVALSRVKPLPKEIALELLKAAFIGKKAAQEAKETKGEPVAG